MDSRTLTLEVPALDKARLNLERSAVTRDSMLTDTEWEAVIDATIEHAATRGPHQGGFTPWALAHMLQDSGSPIDAKTRPWWFGGNVTGPVRLRTRATLGLAFNFYTARSDITHMWVWWSPTKRWHLVHEKGC